MWSQLSKRHMQKNILDILLKDDSVGSEYF